MTDGLFRGNNIETAPCVIRHEPGAADRGESRQAAGAGAGPHSPWSERHPMLAGKATDFFDPFNDARDFTVGPQKSRRSHA